MNKEAIIYFAGILDGEGSIMIDLQSANNVRKYNYFSLRLVVTNTDYKLVSWLQEQFGGKINQRKPIPNRKITFDWKLYSKKAAELIKLTLPYLITKKDRAELFIKFADTVGKTGWNVTQETLKERGNLYNQIKILNKQGKKL